MLTIKQYKEKLQAEAQRISAKLELLAELEQDVSISVKDVIAHATKAKRIYRRKPVKRHRMLPRGEANARMTAALATLHFPFTSKQLRRAAQIRSNGTGSSWLHAKVNGNFLERKGRDLYDKGPMFDELGK